MANRYEKAVLMAALKWWQRRRPVGWTLDQHLDNPRIDAHENEASSLLAREVSVWVDKTMTPKQKERA